MLTKIFFLCLFVSVFEATCIYANTLHTVQNLGKILEINTHTMNMLRHEAKNKCSLVIERKLENNLHTGAQTGAQTSEYAQ